MTRLFLNQSGAKLKPMVPWVTNLFPHSVNLMHVDFLCSNWAVVITLVLVLRTSILRRSNKSENSLGKIIFSLFRPRYHSFRGIELTWPWKTDNKDIIVFGCKIFDELCKSCQIGVHMRHSNPSDHNGLTVTVLAISLLYKLVTCHGGREEELSTD